MNIQEILAAWEKDAEVWAQDTVWLIWIVQDIASGKCADLPRDHVEKAVRHLRGLKETAEVLEVKRVVWDEVKKGVKM